jgi:hypothetical protein
MQFYCHHKIFEFVTENPRCAPSCDIVTGNWIPPGGRSTTCSGANQPLHMAFAPLGMPPFLLNAPRHDHTN